MKICYYLCGVASALLLALPLHSATELGKLPLTTPMDTSAEVTQKIKDSSLKINGSDVNNHNLILSDKFISDIDEVYYDDDRYLITKLSDDPIIWFYNSRPIYVKPLYKYLTNERQQDTFGRNCFIEVSTNDPAIVYFSLDNYGCSFATTVSKANKNSMPPEVKYLTIDDSTMKLNNVLFNRNDFNIDGINVCTSNDIENVYTAIGFSDMIYTKTSDPVIRHAEYGYYLNMYYKPVYYYSTGERVIYGPGTNSFLVVNGSDVYKYYLMHFDKSSGTYRLDGKTRPVNIPLQIESISVDTNRIYSTVFNRGRLATNSTYIALGKNVRTGGRSFNIAIGNETTAIGLHSISVGALSVSSNHAVAVGGHAKAFSTNSVAIGYYSATSNAFSVAIGGNALTGENRTTAIGAQSVANHTNATSVGSEVVSHGEGTFNIYPDTMDKVYLKDNKLSDLVNTAITNQIANVVPSMIPPEKPEPTSLLTNTTIVRIGKNAKSFGGYNVVIGNNAYARGMRSIAIGDNAMVTNCNPLRSVGGIAIGHEAIASNNYAMALGCRAFANDTNSTVIAVGTNTVNSHGINTFTVGLTDNDPLNYFYLGSSSLKSLLDDNYANASQLDSIKGATNITTYVYGEGDDTVYELSLGGVGMIATHPSTDQAQAKFLSIELNSIVSDASYNNQSNCIAFCAKGVFDNPTGPDFSKVSSLFVDGTRVPTEKYCDSRYVKKTDYNNLVNNALTSTNDINLATGKSINLKDGNFKIDYNDPYSYYGMPEVTAGWDSSQQRMKLVVKGPGISDSPKGVIIESSNYNGEDSTITIEGAPGGSGGKLNVEASTHSTVGGGKIYIKGHTRDDDTYFIPDITMSAGDNYEDPEITVGEVKVRESITNLNNSVITKIANQSVTGGNVNLGKGLEFTGNNPLSQFDHKYYITCGDVSYTAFTKDETLLGGGEGEPLYNQDGTRLMANSTDYINKSGNAVVYISGSTSQTITGDSATFTEVPFVKQSNVISISTNIAFNSDVEAVKTHLKQVESDLETFKSDVPVYSNEYGQVGVNLNMDTVGLKISGDDCSIVLKTRDRNTVRSPTLELNGGDYGGSKINVNAGIHQSGSIYVGAATVGVDGSMNPATITIDSAFNDETVRIEGGSMNPDTGSVIPAEIRIGDCHVRKSIDKLTNDVVQVANSLTNSQSVVIGQGAKNNDDENPVIAIGMGARVIGNTRDTSIAIGPNSLCRSSAALNSNIAIGDSATASNYNSVAIGMYATASHPNSISIGGSAKSHGISSFNIALQQQFGNTGLHSVYIDDNNLVTLFDKRMHDINESWVLEDPDGNTRLLTANYSTIYQEHYDDGFNIAGERFNIIEFLDGYSDGYKFTWHSFTGVMSLKIANSSNELTTSLDPSSTVITFTDSNNKTYKVTRKKSYERQSYFDDKINSLITKIQQMETIISNLTQQVNALQNP